jgi:hypothetical protein
MITEIAGEIYDSWGGYIQIASKLSLSFVNLIALS